MFCPSCGNEVAAGSAYCSACGFVVDATLTRTLVSSRQATSGPSSPSSDRSRFLPGTVLADRYRIVGLLGRGGMGEVYRADDLKLGQPVALKFLPAAVADDADRLGRLLHEVKIARQVSHPNVCRVYDVGETDGHHYLSMEYVDGEDLGTLLRRIGRLPNDKALEIARQLCAGLAAAHEQGILHRDLKPANVMIDGRGHAKLTDFGLAGLAGSLEGAELSHGTPTYMAPEQLAGEEVSIRSDIYALGLVLYELFTGKRVFQADSLPDLRRLQRESSPTSPTSFVDGFDPAVERVLFQCLELQPAGRPASALAVAAALPGGDPLAAALAAGETPSPEMVAAAGPDGGLRPWVANSFMAGILAILAVVIFLGQAVSIHARLPFGKSFEAMRDNARDVVRALGYTETPGDTAAWFSFNMNEYFHQLTDGGPGALAEAVETPGQFVASFRYRQSPDPMIPAALNGKVGPNDPPPGVGDVTLVLNLQGHLTYLRARPDRNDPRETDAADETDEADVAGEATAVDEPDGPDGEAPDWAALFEAAGLDLERFEPTDVTRRPPDYADVRAAWSGVLPDHADRPVRIEAAGIDGKTIYFEKVISSDSYWTTEEQETSPSPTRVFIPLLIILLAMLVLIVGGALLLAVRSLRLGRGDRKGAFRIAMAIFALRMLGWTLAADHAGHPSELFALAVATCGAVTLAVLAWIVYVAFEPWVRRLWPELLVSWNRLLAGRFRDPLVGRDVLIGCALATGLQAIATTTFWIGDRVGFFGLVPTTQQLLTMKGGRFVLGEVFHVLLTQLWVSLGIMMLFLLLRLILRRTWIATLALCLLQGAISALNFAAFGDPAVPLLANPATWAGAALGVIAMAVSIGVLVRFGLVALFASSLFSNILQHAPYTLDTSSPFIGIGWFMVSLAVALALYGWWMSLAGRSLLGKTLLEG